MKTVRWRPQAAMVMVLAVVGVCLAYGHAAAWEITVNGNIFVPSGYFNPDSSQISEQYFDQTTTTTSLADFARIDILGQNFGLSSSSGNLATGQLKAFAHAVLNGSGYGTVGIRETIHIHGLLPSPVTGAFIATLEGGLIPNQVYEEQLAPFGSPSAFVSTQLSVNNDYGSFSQYVFQTRGCPSGGIIDTTPGAQVCINATTINYQISIPFTISDVNRDFHLYAGLLAESFGGGIADVSNTASLGLVLPAGLTFTSDSGVFLTQLPPVGQVPEPATLALLSAGMLGLEVVRWRHNHRKW